MTETLNFDTVFEDGTAPGEAFNRTQGITQALERDIINFLSSKYTDNATLTVAEVMDFYHCPEDRARRVIRNLLSQKVLAPAGKDTFRVLI